MIDAIEVVIRSEKQGRDDNGEPKPTTNIETCNKKEANGVQRSGRSLLFYRAYHLALFINCD